MGLLSLFNNKNDDLLNDKTFIKEVHHLAGPWHQYDILLAARGYGWDYIIDSLKYLVSADLCNVGTISVSPVIGAEAKEFISAYRMSEGDIDKIEALKEEAGILGVGGISKAIGNIPVKVVWINQTNMLRIFIPDDNEELIRRYAETLIRRSFNTKDAMKLGQPL